MYRVFIFFSVIFCPCTSYNGTELTVCLNKILNLFPNDKLINLLNVDVVLRHPVIVQSVDYRLPVNLKRFQFERSDIYVINTEVHDLDRLLGYFVRFDEGFHSRASFVLIAERISANLFEIASKYFIGNLIVWCNDLLYTYEPYRYGSVNEPCLEPVELGSCADVAELKFSPFPEKWSGSTVIALVNFVPPYVICTKCEDEPGIEIDALRIVAEKLNFRLDFKTMSADNFTFWGVRLPSGAYSDMFGALQNRTLGAQLVVGVFHSKHREHQDFDMSMTYMEDGAFFVVPKAKVLPHWKRIGLAFDVNVYLSIAVCFSVAFAVTLRRRHRDSVRFLLALYQILLETSLSRNPRRNRVLLYFWILACLVVSTAFKSQLVSLMSKTLYEKQVEDLKGIIDSNLTLLLEDDFANFFRIYWNEYERKVPALHRPCDNPRICINRTAYVQDCAAIDFARSNEYYLPKQYLDPHGDVLLYRTKQIVIPIQLHLYFAKGFPIYQQMDKLLWKMKDFGIIAHLYDKASYSAHRALDQKRSLFTVHVLDLDKSQVAFILWAFGILVATVTFVGEMMVRKLGEPKEKN